MKRNRTSVVVAGACSLFVAASLAVAPLGASADPDQPFFDAFWGKASSGEPVDPSTPEGPSVAEARIVSTADIESLCRAGLSYGGADAAVLPGDSLRIVASAGEVWVVQSGQGGVVAPEPASQAESDAVSDPAPLDLGALGLPEITAVRAASLASHLDGALVADGDLTSVGRQPQDAETPEQGPESSEPAPLDDSPDAPEKDPVQVVSVTWIVLDEQANPASAFVFEFDTSEKDAQPDEQGQTPSEPAPEDVASAMAAPAGRWSSEAAWTSAAASVAVGLSRADGVVPYTPEGLPICDLVWVVDQPAWDENVWVEDQPAWRESVFVETGGHWEGYDAWTCPTCESTFTSWAEVEDHYSNMLGLFYGYIQPSGDPSYPWICWSCGELFDFYESASEHMYAHAEQHSCYQSSWAWWQVDGYEDYVYHDAQGHWETVHHDEVGHWDYPEGVAPKTK